MPPRLLSTTEVADMLGFSRQWVFSLIKKKKLRAYKFGRAYLIPSTAVEKFKLNNTDKG